MSVREQLFTTNPFHDVDVGGVLPDRQGWGSDHPIIRKYIEKLRPEKIAEIGVWKGRCALNMARYCREFGVDAEIICIDTWLGSLEHWMRRDNANFYKPLQIKNGYPHIYWTFVRNVIEEKAEEFITPMPMPSETAFYVLKRLNVSLDMVHIDAGHQYESVIGDLSRYWALLRPGGVLIGDDYGKGWPGVKRAADEFSRGMGCPMAIDEGKFVIEKSS